MGNLKLLGSSLGEVQKDSLGGEEEGRDSASEQKEPLLEESFDEVRNGRLLDMLKYLSSWATAERISALFSVLELKDQESPPFLPNIGSCLTGPCVFLSGDWAGALRTSSRAWTK